MNTRSENLAEDGKVITAKLVRGKTYSYNDNGTYIQFQRNVPVEVSAEVAAALEEIVEIVNTDDGDSFEKERFEIDYDADARVEEKQPTKRLRMRLVEVDERPSRVVDATTRAGPVGKRTPLRQPIRR